MESDQLSQLSQVGYFFSGFLFIEGEIHQIKATLKCSCALEVPDQDREPVNNSKPNTES